MHARLTVEAGLAVPPVHELNPYQVVRLGRNNANTIVVNDRHASRMHAEVYADDNGNWFLRDCETTNGTRVNDERVSNASVPLPEGSLIAIGDTRLRFNRVAAEGVREETDEIPSLGENEEPHVVHAPAEDSEGTTLHADELTSLFRFMTRSLDEATPYGLVKLALEVLLRQTRADSCGFLSLDVEGPEFKLVLPSQAPVDTHLSRKLTAEAQRERRTVWLGAGRRRDLDSDSLLNVHDAICIPLQASRAAERQTEQPETPLGALHIYKARSSFADSEVRFCEVLAGCLANTLLVLRSRRALEADNSRLRVRDPSSEDGLIGTSAVMKQVRENINRLANYPCTVLLVGESGVGKELAALALHKGSRRGAGPMVAVNCAAIPAGLAEAELFGHDQGGFTGATEDRPGYFSQADEGTLFLDEIGELPLDIQAKLLRVMETKCFRPVRGKSDVKVDVRIIAATNRDLKREVSEGRFRKDLFYRLGTTLQLPPLREHAEDIPALADHFLQMFAAEYHRRVRLSETALQRLQSYAWPGNVRQLRSVLETSLAMTHGDTIHPGDLRLAAEAAEAAETNRFRELPTSLKLEELEAWAIREALAQTNGNNSQAAPILGIHRDTLIAKMKKYQIDRRTPRSEP